MTKEDFPRAVAALERAQHMRAMALAKVHELCETGQRHKVMPFLLENMRRHPELGKIRLWQLDAVMFGTTRDRAIRWIRKTRELIGDTSTMPDGYTSLAWALESRESSVRMAAWLYELLLREHLCKPERPEDFPYGALFDHGGRGCVMNRHS